MPTESYLTSAYCRHPGHLAEGRHRRLDDQRLRAKSHPDFDIAGYLAAVGQSSLRGATTRNPGSIRAVPSDVSGGTSESALVPPATTFTAKYTRVTGPPPTSTRRPATPTSLLMTGGASQLLLRSMFRINGYVANRRPLARVVKMAAAYGAVWEVVVHAGPIPSCAAMSPTR